MTAPLVQLPTDDADHVVITTYTWADGYRPTVVADQAVPGRTGRYVLCKVDVVEPADPTAYEVHLFGWPVRADGSFNQDHRAKWFVNDTVRRELWRQHKGLDG